MSYDLVVWVPRAATGDEIVDLVESRPGLALSTVTDTSATIVRGARGRYSFTVDGPFDVEPEDVPYEVTAAVLGVRHLYRVLVEGSTSSEIPHATRFAKLLAEHLGGAVEDPQEGTVLARKGLRAAPRPERESRVTTVDLEWHCVADNLPDNAPRLLHHAARDLLPEALPRRFGDYEPLQGHLDRDGVDGLTARWRDVQGSLFTAGTFPCVGGLIAGPPREGRRYWKASLSFLAEPLETEGWREAAHALLARLAEDFHAFHAHAVTRAGAIWTGRSLMYDGHSETWPTVLPLGGEWMGLQRDRVWWTWLGAPHAPWADRLPEERTTVTPHGVLYDATAAVHGTEEPLSMHLPSELFAIESPSPHRSGDVLLTQAPTIPPQLRG